jgi:peroxiredoxin (alkyl hydroperoxide reductase subunit C)
MLINRPFPSNYLLKVVNHKVETIDIFHESKGLNSKVLLFWYPKDFSTVCPTELFALQELLSEFERLNTKVIAVSCDTIETHKAWLKTPKNKGGIEGITFPITSDSRRELSSDLFILDYDKYDDENMGDNVSYRATYLIDERGIVFHESINNMFIGRNIHEYIRLIEAYNQIQKTQGMCPANWKKGDKTI